MPSWSLHGTMLLRFCLVALRNPGVSPASFMTDRPATQSHLMRLGCLSKVLLDAAFFWISCKATTSSLHWRIISMTAGMTDVTFSWNSDKPWGFSAARLALHSYLRFGCRLQEGRGLSSFATVQSSAGIAPRPGTYAVRFRGDRNSGRRWWQSRRHREMQTSSISLPI